MVKRLKGHVQLIGKVVVPLFKQIVLATNNGEAEDNMATCATRSNKFEK
jgi:hypothetical protein